MLCRDDRGQLKRRTEHRFVPTREHPPRVRWLHLRRHSLVPRAAGLLVARQVDALRSLAEFSAELDVDAVLPGRQFLWRSQGQKLRRIIALRIQRLAVRGGLHHCEPHGVHHQSALWRFRFHVDIHRPAKRRGRHVRLNPDRVMPWHDILRQSPGSLFKSERLLRESGGPQQHEGKAAHRFTVRRFPAVNTGGPAVNSARSEVPR